MMKPLEWLDVRRVAENMCDRHSKNVCMTGFSDDPVEAVSYLMHPSDKIAGVTVWKDDEPVAVAGAIITHPGRASTFFFGTIRWHEMIFEVTRYFHKGLRAELARKGIKRVSIFAPAGDPDGERWKRLGGAKLEATLKSWGKNDEDFSLFVVSLSS